MIFVGKREARGGERLGAVPSGKKMEVALLSGSEETRASSLPSGFQDQLLFLLDGN